jgi:L-amino acid N-acyltransferase YncA
MDIDVAEMADSDWPAVAAIYKEGIATGHATFEEDAPDWDVWNAKHLRPCRLVAKAGGKVVGWVVLSPVSSRCVYKGVAEVSVYVKASLRSQGIGRTLLKAVVGASEQAGIWTLQSGIFPENIASQTIHQQCGFRLVGYRERLGQMNGVWRDVVLMERRSRIAGL